jgi:hypothetical protein
MYQSCVNYVGMFSNRGRVCVFVIDDKDHDQHRRDNGMEMASSTVKRNNDRWIPFRFPDDHHILIQIGGARSRRELISCVRYELEFRPSLDTGEPVRSLKC